MLCFFLPFFFVLFKLNEPMIELHFPRDSIEFFPSRVFISKKQWIIKLYVVHFESLFILETIVQEIHKYLIKWNFKCAFSYIDCTRTIVEKLFFSLDQKHFCVERFSVGERYAQCHAKIVRDLDLVTVRLSAMKHGLSSSMRLLRAGYIAGDARERWLERGVFLPRQILILWSRIGSKTFKLLFWLNVIFGVEISIR